MPLDVCIEVWGVELSFRFVCNVYYLTCSVQLINASLPDEPPRPLKHAPKHKRPALLKKTAWTSMNF